MDFIKTKNCGGPMDVIFDGRFIFIEKFLGLVAIAQPVMDEDYNLVGYHIERTLAIGMPVIKRVVTKYLVDVYTLIDKEQKVQKMFFEDCTIHRFVGSLPYKIELNLTK